MKQIDYTQLHPELFGKMTRQGAFLTTKGAGGRLNTMTIGWGSVGYYWRRPVFTCVVRQSRFTDRQLKENPVFTVSDPRTAVWIRPLPSAAASRAAMRTNSPPAS